MKRKNSNSPSAGSVKWFRKNARDGYEYTMTDTENSRRFFVKKIPNEQTKLDFKD